MVNGIPPSEPPYTALIAYVANRAKVDPRLITAVVQHESSGNPGAWNPEPTYRYFWDVKRHRPFRTLTNAEVASKTPPADFPTLAGAADQEWWGQQASWGLMQVMGAVARELGYVGPYLTALCEPAVGLEYGADHLAHQLTWAKGNVAKALSAYNAGRLPSSQGAAYAVKVLAIYNRLGTGSTQG